MSAKTDCSDSEDLSLGDLLVRTKCNSGSYSIGFSSIGNVEDDVIIDEEEQNVIKSHVIRRGTLVDGDFNVDNYIDERNSDSEESSTDDFTPNQSPFRSSNGIS